MQQEWIVIRGVGSVSGLGSTPEEIAQTYAQGNSCFATFNGHQKVAVSPISPSSEVLLQNLLKEKPKYAGLDRSVLLAIAASRQAVQQAGWDLGTSPIGINLGSSRGATELYEKYHSEYLSNPEGRLAAAASPSTTLGNLASSVAQDLLVQGPLISHSVTCSTALQAIANGVAWLKAGMAKRFLVGGTEAPLTGFTLAQMKSTGIYSPFGAEDHPCRPFNGSSNTFVLGEGATVFALERLTEQEISQLPSTERLVITGVGMGLELTPSKTGVSEQGLHFQKSLLEAIQLSDCTPAEIDAIILHAPGTKAGDAAELKAIESVFPATPSLYTNKSIIGHTLGASGAMSMTLALHILSIRQVSSCLQLHKAAESPLLPKRVLINAAGFGGNSSSLVLQSYN